MNWFYKPSCARKPQIRAICIYVRYTKVITNNIRLSVTIKALLVNISWMARQIHTIELTLKSTHQTVSNNNNISYIIWRLVFIEIQVYQYSDIISYLLKLAWHLLWQITAPPDMSFNLKITCAQTITILYKYFCIWGLDLRLNNISFYQFLSLLNFWITLKPLRVYSRFKYHK